LETELKLRFLDPKGREILLEDEWFQTLALPDPPEETHMEAIYYDTADGRLHARRAVFRIRLEGDRYIASIKARGKVSEGLHQRLEWNLVQEDDKPDLPSFGKSRQIEGDGEGILQELIEAVGDEDLVEVCRTEFDRLSYLVGYGDTLIEVAFDSGKLEADGKSVPMEELELELKEGDVRDLILLGDELTDRFPVAPEERSKYSRCMELKKKGK
jgi:triphosphatase